MQVAVSIASGDATRVELQEVQVLNQLVTATPRGTTPSVLDAALRTAGAGSATGDGKHTWLCTDWLRHNGSQDAAWQADFTGVLTYAKSKGWLSDDGLSVRAHVVHT